MSEIDLKVPDGDSDLLEQIIALIKTADISFRNATLDEYAEWTRNTIIGHVEANEHLLTASPKWGRGLESLAAIQNAVNGWFATLPLGDIT